MTVIQSLCHIFMCRSFRGPREAVSYREARMTRWVLELNMKNKHTSSLFPPFFKKKGKWMLFIIFNSLIHLEFIRKYGVRWRPLFFPQIPSFPNAFCSLNPRPALRWVGLSGPGAGLRGSVPPRNLFVRLRSNVTPFLLLARTDTV